MNCSTITDEPVLESGITNEVFMLDSEGNIATAQKALGKLYKIKKYIMTRLQEVALR